MVNSLGACLRQNVSRETRLISHNLFDARTVLLVSGACARVMGYSGVWTIYARHVGRIEGCHRSDLPARFQFAQCSTSASQRCLPHAVPPRC